MNSMSSWHSSYSVTDRQKVIQILTQTLKEIQGASYDETKAANMSQEFEKYTFVKSASREEYLRLIKQKVTQLRAGLRQPPSQGQPGGQPGFQNQNHLSGQNQSHQIQSHQNQNHQNAQMPLNQLGGFGLGMDFSRPAQTQPIRNMNMNSQGLQNQNQNLNQNPNLNQNQNLSQGQNLNLGLNQTQNVSQPSQQQIQQISQMIRTVPIPQALLAKIPNLPPNINTWTQIYDCFQKKIVPALAMPIIKEIHNAHFQLALRQNQQEKLAHFRRMGQDPNFVDNQNQNMNQSQNINQSQSISQSQNMNQGQNINLNLGSQNQMGQNPGQNMAQGMGSQSQNMGIQNNGSHKGNLPQSMPNMNQNLQMNGQMNQKKMGMENMGNMLGNPMMNQNFRKAQNAPSSAPVHSMPAQNASPSKAANIHITSQDLVKYSGDAMALLSRLQQNGSVSANLDQALKLNFVRKYIYHQKLNAFKAQQKAQPNMHPQNLGSNVMNFNMNQNQNQMNQNQSQVQSQNIQGQNMNQNNQNQGQNMNQNQNQIQGNQMQNHMPNQNQLNIQGHNQMPLNVPRNVGVNQTLANMNFNPGMNMQRNSVGNFPLKEGTSVPPAPRGSSLLPTLTEELKTKLRSLFEEVSRSSVPLKDVTMMLSDKEKAQVAEIMVRITQQYSNVDSILSYFFVLTKNVEGTRRLIQMKNMTKNIIDNLQRGVYLAGPELLEKMRAQYQKHFDYVKDQVNMRRAQQARLNQMPVQVPESVVQPALNMQNAPNPNMPQGFNNLQPMQNLKNMPAAVSPVVTTSPAKSGKTVPRKTPVPRKKQKNLVSAIPTPAASAPTPATLANAIKTPNSVPTPQIPVMTSNKGTPIEISPQASKGSAENSVPLAKDVFATGEIDSKLMQRRELSKLQPQDFLLSALSNLLELPEEDDKKKVSSPLETGWTSRIKPHAIVSAFMLVDYVEELSRTDVLDECAEMVEIEFQEKESALKRKSEDDDLDMLFEESKSDDFARCMNEPLELDSWNAWIGKLSA